MNWIITFIILILLVIVFALSFVYIKIQISKVIAQLQAILEGKTKKLVTISLCDRYLEAMVEIINRIVMKERNRFIEIEKREDAIKENIACVSHDLRTPLTSIRGYLQLLDNAPDDKREKYIDVLQKKAFRLEQLIDDFYQISLLDGGNYVLENEVINISDLLTEILLENYHLFSEKNIQPEIHAPENEVSIYADKSACVRIIQNLLFNALEETFGSIFIQLVQVSENVVLIFRNPVNDIKAIEPDKIFERFYMRDRSRGHGHSGQGLYIVKKLLMEMQCDPPTVSVADDYFSICVKWKVIGDRVPK